MQIFIKRQICWLCRLSYWKSPSADFRL